MTEKEFDQIRNSSYTPSSKHSQRAEDSSSYFSYLKLRCLICIIILLSIILLDRQIDLKQYDEVAQCVKLLGEDEVTVQDCWNIINPSS